MESIQHDEGSVDTVERRRVDKECQHYEFLSKLLSVIDEPSRTRRHRIQTKGGICRQNRCISNDIKQYEGAMRELKKALESMEMQKQDHQLL